MRSKNLINIFFIFLSIFFSFSFIFATQVNSHYINGILDFNLDKETYFLNETINVEIEISNPNNFVFSDGFLVINIVRGEEFYYPSQISNNDTILYEETISLNMLDDSKSGLNYSFNIPDYFNSGVYRIDIYYRTYLSPIVGLSHILQSPISKNFNIISGNPIILPKIDRLQTHVIGGFGPVGLGTNRSDVVVGQVCLNSSFEEDNYVLRIKMAQWDDSIRDIIFEKEKNFNLKEGENCISIRLPSDFEPNAYAIRFEIFDSNENLIEMYRNRLIIQGPASVLRKLVGSKLFYFPDEIVKHTVIIGPSPDHYTYPQSDNVELKFYILNENQDVVYSQVRFIGNISSDDGLIDNTFIFTSEILLKDYTVCAEVFNSTHGFDKYCYEVNLEDFNPNENFVEVYTQNNKLKIESFFNSDFDVLIIENSTIIKQETFYDTNKIELEGFSNKEEYFYQVYDKDFKKQYTGNFQINFFQEEIQESQIQESSKLKNQISNFSFIFLFILVLFILFIIYTVRGLKK